MSFKSWELVVEDETNDLEATILTSFDGVDFDVDVDGVDVDIGEDVDSAAITAVTDCIDCVVTEESFSTVLQ